MTSETMQIGVINDSSMASHENSRGSLFDQFILVVILVLTIIGPGFKLNSSIPSLRIEDLLLIFVFFRIAMSGTRVVGQLLLGNTVRSLTVPFLVLTCWIALVSAVDMVDSGFQIAPNIAIYLATTFKGPLIIMVIVALSQRLNITRLLVMAAVASMLLECILLLVQYEDYFGASNWLTSLYRDEAEERYLRLSARTVGSFGNPNSTAVGLVVLSTLASSASIFHPQKCLRVLNLVIVFLVGMAIFVFTESRTGLAGFLAATLVPIAFGFAMSKYRATALTYLGLLSGSTFLLFERMSSTFEQQKERFALFSGSESLQTNLSFSTRQANWTDIIGSMGWEVVTGGGVGRVLKTITDSGYITIIAISGLIGLTIYAIIIFNPMMHIISVMRRNMVPAQYIYVCISGVSCIIGLLVCSTGMVFYGNTRIWATYCCILGISFSVSSNLGKS